MLATESPITEALKETTASSIKVDGPAEVAERIRREQPERWQVLHADNPSILVVDDNRRTAHRFADGLVLNYGERVEEVSDPRKVASLVRSRKQQGIPYDIIVLDVHLDDSLLGTQIAKELGADCPPIVFNTGSMTAPVVANLKIQVDSFSAHNVISLIDRHLEERRELGVPQAPIFVHLKHAPWEDLIAKIDSARLLARERSDTLGAHADFLDYFSPKDLVVTVPELAAHSLVEDIANALAIIRPAIETLIREHNLTNTPWWARNGETLTAALAQLSQATYTEVKRGTTMLTWNQIHGLANEFDNLAPGDLTYQPGDPEFQSYSQWLTAFQEYQAIVGRIEAETRAFVSDKIDFKKVLQLLAAKHDLRCISDTRPDIVQVEPLVFDKDEVLRSVLEEACELFAQHIALAARQSEVGYVEVRYRPEAERIAEAPEVTRTLSRLNAGAYFEVSFVASDGQSFDQIFYALRSQLPNLQTAQIATFRFQEKTDQAPSKFSFFIKATDAQLNITDYRAAISLQAENPTAVISLRGQASGVKIYSRAEPTGSITCIGALPQELDLRAASGYLTEFSGMIFEYKGETFFAADTRHKFAARLITNYLSARESDSQRAYDLPSENEVYRDGVRVSIARGVYVEPDDDSRKSTRAIEALVQFGVLRDRIVISEEHFPASKFLLLEPEEKPVYVRRFFDCQPIVGVIEQAFSNLKATSTFQQTITDYQSVVTGPGIKEPSFIIRSTRGLTAEQKRSLCETLMPILGALDLDAFGIETYSGNICIGGRAPRKSGLFTFDPSYRGRPDDFSECLFSQKLRPLIEGSVSNRLCLNGIVAPEGRLLPAQSVVFGGGDHSLSSCKQQWGLALALELALQALSIPYDSCRGDLQKPDAFVRYNGTSFEVGGDRSKFFEELLEFEF